jgi:Tol biopolymer transport system component
MTRVAIAGLIFLICGTSDFAAKGRFVETAALPAAVKPFPAGLSGTLVFHSDLRGPGNPEGRSRIYTLDLAKGVVTALTTGSNYRDENPRWSPDGQRIAFKSNRANGAYDIYVMNADASNPVRITDHAANDHDPAWMPDGQSLIFMSERDSRGDLYRVWLADKRVERLTRNFVGRAMMPNVSPDGKLVAFAAQSLQRMQFWLFQVNVLELNGNRTRALDATGGSCWPAWSPDGKSLAHVMLDKEPSMLQITSADGKPQRQLTGDAKLWHYYPEWSPDGTRIAFSISPAHHEGENWDLAVIGADGRGYQKLTTGPGNDRVPDWKR